jgi:hypothetical protein
MSNKRAMSIPHGALLLQLEPNVIIERVRAGFPFRLDLTP